MISRNLALHFFLMSVDVKQRKSLANNASQVVVLCHEAHVVEDLVKHRIGDDGALLGGAEHLVHVLLGVHLDAAVLLAVPEM